MHIDSYRRIQQIRAATGRLLMTVRALNESDTTSPSLCEGWSRGHVLSHIAQNADSLVNLMTWAKTGLETPQYESWQARDAAIESAADRSVGEHLAAIRESAALFELAAQEVPDDRWTFTVRGIGGDSRPASDYLMARRREVEVHHVDLDTDYTSKDWSIDFVTEELASAASRFSAGGGPSFEIEASDLALVHRVGDGHARGRISGPGHRVLLWLYGRSDGKDLHSDMSALPKLPLWG